MELHQGLVSANGTSYYAASYVYLTKLWNREARIVLMQREAARSRLEGTGSWGNWTALNIRLADPQPSGSINARRTAPRQHDSARTLTSTSCFRL